MEFAHVPVLLDECLSSLAIKPEGIYVDGTVGGAGHSSHILTRLGPGGLLIGTDRDSEALAAAEEKLGHTLDAIQEDAKPDYRLVKSNFADIPSASLIKQNNYRTHGRTHFHIGYKSLHKFLKIRKYHLIFSLVCNILFSRIRYVNLFS